MAKNKLRTIILCEGGKQELEEMTGEAYEYIDPRQVNDLLPDRLKLPYVTTAFIKVDLKTSNFRPLRNLLYKEAEKVQADAVIHYKEGMTQRPSDNFAYNYAYAQGTPVKKVK